MSNKINISDLSRREMLTGMGAALGAAVLSGCGADGVDDPALTEGPDGADDGSGGEPGGMPGQPDATPTDPLARCMERSNQGAAELLAHIDTIVILCMENRSFDHYLGALSLVEGRGDIAGLTGAESNPDSAGAPVGIFPLETYTQADPPHKWEDAHEQWNNGLNDGFVRIHNGEAMGYFTRDHLPVLYALSDGAAVCNHWYSSVLGPTWPNRFYLHGGTADGRTGNLPLTGFRSIFDLLDEGGISHSNYFHDVAFATGGYFKLSGLDGIETYFEHAAAGTLPQVCVIDPKFFGQGANDDHPDHDVRLGQALIASVFRALAESPQWSRSLFVLTYDEHGGFYDHVAPPQTQDERVDFRQLGFRVPSLVAGPTVRHGCAIDETLDHTSVVATLTRRFGLDILNDRVAVTRDLSLCIDPELIDNPRPAPELPVLDISRRAIAERPAAATHGEIAQVVNAMRLPRHLDRRGRDMEISNLWLERAARLGAVHLID